MMNAGLIRGALPPLRLKVAIDCLGVASLMHGGDPWASFGVPEGFPALDTLSFAHVVLKM